MCLFSMAISKSFAQGQSDPLRRLSMRLPFGRWMSMDFNGCQDSFANVFYYVSFRSHCFARAGAQGHSRFYTWYIWYHFDQFYLLAVVPEDGKDHLQQGNWIMKLSDINIQLELEPSTILFKACRSSFSMAARIHLKEGSCCQNDGRGPGPSVLTLSTSFGFTNLDHVFHASANAWSWQTPRYYIAILNL